MKVLGLIATPRRGGNVDQLVEAVLAGAREGGAEVEKVNVYDLHIEPCRSCMKCREAPHVCPLADDLEELFRRIAGADALVVGAPVHYSNVPAPLLAVFERLAGHLNAYPRRGVPRPLLPPGKRVVYVTSCTAPAPFAGLFGFTGGVYRALRAVSGPAGFREAGRLAETGTWREGPARPRLAAQARRLGLRLARRA